VDAAKGVVLEMTKLTGGGEMEAQLQSEGAFRRYLRDIYYPAECPAGFEEMGDQNPRFVPATHYVEVNVHRYYRMLRLFQAYISNLEQSFARPLGLDIGVFPGSWVRLARVFWPQIQWQGIGLCMSDAFRSWAEEEDLPLMEVDLDPFYAKVEDQISCADGSVDVIVATEILEHLISPLVFLRECQRVLKPGGLLFATTPNVSNIGSVWKLIRGKSNYERLLSSPMYQIDNEWRGHVRFYARSELQWLAEQHQFSMVEHHYYHDDYPVDVLRGSHAKNSFAYLLRRIAGIVPWFRGGHIMVLRKQ